MTAPIQEPTNERALQGLAYARDQIFRRPAPVGGGVNETAAYFGWQPDSTGSVSSNTWTDVGAIGSALATYVSTENNTNYSVNFGTCVIEWTVSSVIYVIGQVRFADTLSAGNVVGVRLQFGGGVGATDVVNTHAIPGGGANFGSTSHFYDVCGWTFGIGTVKLEVYHDNASARALESADLSCMTVAFEDELDVIFT